MADDRLQIVTLEDYLRLITSAHNQMPRYMQTVALSLRPHIDTQLEACRLIGLFDLDRATGRALDFVGQWIGLTRFLSITADIWFSFDTPNLGFDEGRWRAPFEEEFKIIRLEDEEYRTLLRARVLGNSWDGTIPGAYRAWDTLFAATGHKMLIQDQLARPEPDVHGNMHVWQILTGPPLTEVTKILFQGGYLGLRSAGVGTGYMIQSQPDSGFDGTQTPLFAFDSDPSVPDPQYPDQLLGGFDIGAWGEVLPPLPGHEPQPQTRWDDGESFWDEGASLWDLLPDYR